MTDPSLAPEVTITIGDETVPVPVMTFAALEQAWPAIRDLAKAGDMIAQASAGVAILAAALRATRPDLDAATIKSRLIGTQFVALVQAVPRLLQASGLVPAASGEAAGS